MLFTLTFKMPDVFDQINEQVNNEEEQKEAQIVAEKFVSDGEYTTIEINTETKTASVKEI